MLTGCVQRRGTGGQENLREYFSTLHTRLTLRLSALRCHLLDESASTVYEAVFSDGGNGTDSFSFKPSAAARVVHMDRRNIATGDVVISSSNNGSDISEAEWDFSVTTQ